MAKYSANIQLNIQYECIAARAPSSDVYVLRILNQVNKRIRTLTMYIIGRQTVKNTLMDVQTN